MNKITRVCRDETTILHQTLQSSQSSTIGIALGHKSNQIMTKRLDDDLFKVTEGFHDKIKRADFDTILGSLGFFKTATSSLIDRKL